MHRKSIEAADKLKDSDSEDQDSNMSHSDNSNPGHGHGHGHGHPHGHGHGHGHDPGLGHGPDARHIPAPASTPHHPTITGSGKTNSEPKSPLSPPVSSSAAIYAAN